MRTVALFALLCGCLFVCGFLMSESVKITARNGKQRTDLDVTVTVPDVLHARTVTVFGCSAEHDDNGVFCTDEWDRASAQEIRGDQRQYPFAWHFVPRGMIQISAVVADVNGKTLASGQTRVFR